MKIRCGVLIVSDRVSAGKAEDKCCEVIREKVKEISCEVIRETVVPDSIDEIVNALLEFSRNVDLILTSGGTGVAPRDVTPEATMKVIDRKIPGFAEIMRMKSFEITPHGLISRAVTGTKGETLIINLPGSPKAVSECLDWIIPAIPHTIDLIKDRVDSCG